MEYQELVICENNYLLDLARNVEIYRYMYDMSKINESLSDIISIATARSKTRYASTVLESFPEDFQDDKVNTDKEYKKELISACLTDLISDKTPEKIVGDLDILENYATRFRAVFAYCMTLSAESFLNFVKERNKDNGFSVAEICSEIGNEHFMEQDYVEAINHYKTAIATNPDFSFPYINKSIAFKNMGLYHAAIDSLTDCLELFPRNKIVWHELAQDYIMLEKYKKARKFLLRSLQIDPDFEDSKKLLALLDELNL
ncbi:MAG: tetratricopeptide repeat protein [Candidatus Pacearchaeota archaeon]|jgi:tetratricopeptide (TPR) repeat protein